MTSWHGIADIIETFIMLKIEVCIYYILNLGIHILSETSTYGHHSSAVK